MVDLRERHLEYWTPYSEINPREHNSNRSTYHLWCALLPKRALVTRSPSQINVSPVVICSTARFRLRVRTLRFETATWNQSNSPTCDLCDADDIQDEQHVLFHCYSRSYKLIYALLTYKAAGLARSCIRSKIYLHLNSFWMHMISRHRQTINLGQFELTLREKIKK